LPVTITASGSDANSVYVMQIKITKKVNVKPILFFKLIFFNNNCNINVIH